MKALFSAVFALVSITSAFAIHPPDSLLRLSLKGKNTYEQVNLMCEAAVWWRDKGSFDSAQAVLNQAMTRAKEKSDSASVGLVYYHQGGVNWRMGQYEDARISYQKSISIRQELSDDSGAASSYINLALVQRDISNYDASLRTLRTAKELYQELNDSSGLADVLTLSGGVFLRLNNYDSASSNFHNALSIRHFMSDSSSIASSFTNLATLYKTKGDFDSSVFYFNEALSLQKRLGNKSNIAFTYLSLGGLYWEMKDYHNAIDNYIESLRIYEKGSDKIQTALVLENIGLIYRDLGNIDRSLEYHNSVLEIYKSIGNPLRESIALNFIAGDYLTAKNYTKALDYYKASYTIREQLNNKQLMAATCNSLGMVYKNLDISDSSHFYYFKAYDLYTDLGDLRNQAATLNNIANLKWKINDVDSTMYYFKMALASRQLIMDVQGEGYTMLQFGQFLMENKKNKRAYDMAIGAFNISQQINDWTLKKDASLLLSKYFETVGNYKQAHSYFKLYNESQEALNRDETIKRIADMEIRFEHEKRVQALERKQFEIELKDSEIKQKNQRYYYMLGALVLLMGLVVTVFIAWRQKIRTNKILNLQKQEIEAQRDQISSQNEKITDSIVYASRIQKAMLPPESVINNLFPDHFVFFKPRDVVSGDFYWVHSENNYRVIVVADCTGHGVPGAFMSMMGVSLLNELTGQYSSFDAAKLLGSLREKVCINLHQTTYTDGSSNDSIDMGMIIIENSTNKACYAGGNIPLWVYRDKTLTTYNADRMPIGIHIGEEMSFTNNFVQLQKGDTIFMFSDGFPDQFGGTRNRKLLVSGFKKIIESIAETDIEKQATLLEKNLQEWKKDTRQIDDIIVLGVKI